MTEKLTTPWFRVVLDDDTEHTVRATNWDLCAYDLERNRRPDWPTMDAGPAFGQTYVAWHALKRVEAIAAMTFAEFQQRALQVEGIESKDRPAEVDPTPPAAEAG